MRNLASPPWRGFPDCGVAVDPANKRKPIMASDRTLSARPKPAKPDPEPKPAARAQAGGGKSQSLQDAFLNLLRRSKAPVTMFLVKGVKLQGIVTWFDNFSILLRRD